MNEQVRCTSECDPPTLPDDATRDQIKAFEDLVCFFAGERSSGNAVRLLSGYAGTGKTWLVVHLVQRLCAMNLRVAVCAPTHKAVAVIAGKLAEVGGANAWTGTLHALLGLKLKENHDGRMEIELDRQKKGVYLEDYDVVIIDESSMVGATLLSHINWHRKGAKTRILYVGDPGQLLPVEPDVDRESVIDPYTDTLFDDLAHVPPVFQHVSAPHHLGEVVRQKSTGRPHPIITFSQEIRRYIEGDAQGVFDPATVREYLADHADEFGGAIRVAGRELLGEGAASLRRRRPEKDIRVVAYRNLVVDEHNRFIHCGLASLYGVGSKGGLSPDAPFWPGEAIVAREALYGFDPAIDLQILTEDDWELALSPNLGAGTRRRPKKGSVPGKKAESVQNNTEMTVLSCDAVSHPYLGIASWRIVATAPDGHAVQFMVASDPSEHRRLTRRSWEAYRSAPHRLTQDSMKAWTVTRACAPVTHAYAMTTHKAQGSTFHYALIDLPDLYRMTQIHGVTHYHRGLYVAVTRAAERVWVCF
ncbi:MAG: ATP-dependent DNA helicase [Acidiferrobacterales bacterium]